MPNFKITINKINYLNKKLSKSGEKAKKAATDYLAANPSQKPSGPGSK